MSRTPMTDRERAHIEHTLARYESLCADLRDTLLHGWPSPNFLEEKGTPLIDLWRFGSRGVIILTCYRRVLKIFNTTFSSYSDGWKSYVSHGSVNLRYFRRCSSI